MCALPISALQPSPCVPFSGQASASRVRERYERLARERQRAAEDAQSLERRREQEHAASAAVARTNFKGSISSVFTPYLG